MEELRETLKLHRKSNETENKRCAYGNGIEMYIGIPRIETEKCNERQEKK
jgi:hypothetical protein